MSTLAVAPSPARASSWVRSSLGRSGWVSASAVNGRERQRHVLEHGVAVRVDDVDRWACRPGRTPIAWTSFGGSFQTTSAMRPGISTVFLTAVGRPRPARMLRSSGARRHVQPGVVRGVVGPDHARGALRRGRPRSELASVAASRNETPVEVDTAITGRSSTATPARVPSSMWPSDGARCAAVRASRPGRPRRASVLEQVRRWSSASSSRSSARTSAVPGMSVDLRRARTTTWSRPGTARHPAAPAQRRRCQHLARVERRAPRACHPHPASRGPAPDRTRAAGRGSPPAGSDSPVSRRDVAPGPDVRRGARRGWSCRGELTRAVGAREVQPVRVRVEGHERCACRAGARDLAAESARSYDRPAPCP